MSWKMMTSHSKFTPFFWTQFWGAFNDNFFKNALIMIVAFRGIQILGMDYKSVVALSGGLFILPFFLFSPLAGQISDKYEKSKIVRITKIWEIIIMLLAAIGFLTQSYVMLLGILFLMGTQSAFFGPAKYSILPELVDSEELVTGNAYIELGTFLSILLGTIAGGATESLPGKDPVIATGLILFAILGYLSARKVPQVKVGDSSLKIQINPFPELVSLWKIIRVKKVLFNSVLAISWFWFFGAGVLSVLPIYVKDYLMGTGAVATLFLATFTLGVGLGSLLCEKLSYKQAELGLVPIGSLGLTLFIGDLYFVGSPWLGQPPESVGLMEMFSSFSGLRILFDFFTMSLFGGLFIVPLYTLLQERSDSDKRSRVIASLNIMNALFMVVASLLLMVFYSWGLSPVEIFLIFAILNAVVAIYIYSIVPEFTLRFCSWILSHVIYSIETKGLEHIPKKGGFILASNHVSYVDWLLLGGACKRPLCFVMYYKFFKFPIIKSLMKQAKVIPVAARHEDEQIMNRAFERVSESLKQGEAVGIFPEGELTLDGTLGELKPGVLKILKKDPVPVVPVVIKGMWPSLFSKSQSKKGSGRRKVVIEFFAPIEAKDFTLQELQSIYNKSGLI